jgi:hypothetical protein
VNEPPERFSIPRSTGTHGDIFAAVGLADLLLGTRAAETVRIVDDGLGFQVRMASNGGSLIVPQNPGYPFLKANDKTVVPSGITDFVDYPAENAKADRRKKLAQRKSREHLGAELQELLEQDQPRPDWRLLQVLNRLRGGETSNRIHALIIRLKPEEFSRAVAGGLEALAGSRRSNVDWPASAVQLFTPNAAKGYSRLKPDSTGRNDKTKEEWVDPFVEWLRYRGYFVVGCPFFQAQNADVRLLCPIPRDVSIQALKELTFELRATWIPGGPPKLDSLAVLKLAELLIRRSEFHDTDHAALLGNLIRGKSPADIISGISVTHYQSLGNAKAVSAMSTIALPGWFPINSADDASDFLAILDEHQRVVRSLQDDHSDEIGMLIDYRRFLESRGDHSAMLLIDFVAVFGQLVLRVREQNRKIPQFTTTNLKRLLMDNGGLTDILSDRGFLSVAAAIRSATVSAQAQKAMKRSDYREIRYDLLPELRRRSSLPGDQPLIQALSDFISKFNVENARRRELGKPAPRNVTTEEFAALVRLLDIHHAATVGPMLCAFGSCRVPREDEQTGDGQDVNAEAE